MGGGHDVGEYNLGEDLVAFFSSFFFSPSCTGISQPTQQIQKRQLLAQVDTIQTEI